MARDWSELFITDGTAPDGDAGEDGEGEDAGQPRRRGFFRRLRENLSKTRQALGSEIQATLFQTLDEHTWERLEEALIMADVGAPTTAAVVLAPTSAMISASSRRSQVCSSRSANSVAWISLPSAWRVRDMLSRRRRRNPRRGCSASPPGCSCASAVMNSSLQSRGTSGATIAAVVAYATSATSPISGSCPLSNSRWREITFETPSWPIDTPNSQSAASIVRFWWVMTMNWARPQ